MVAMKIKIEVKEINCDVIVKENFWNFLFDITSFKDVRVDWKYKKNSNTLKIIDMNVILGDAELIEIVFPNKTSRDLVVGGVSPKEIIRKIIKDIFYRLYIIINGGGVDD